MTGAFEDRRHNLQRRLTILRVVAYIAFGTLLATFWVLQVIKYAEYSDMARNNHLRTIPLRAPRGILYDRNEKVLVENRSTRTIAIIRERSPNVAEAVRRLAKAVGVDEEILADIVQRKKKDPLFRPIAMIEHASDTQVAAVMARRLELPEVIVQEEPTRAYPIDGFAAHLFGYVSEIQESQLERPEFEGLQAGAVVGQAGIEKVYNARLMGTDGKKDVVVNSFGREMKELGEEAPTRGQRMQLTIDYDMQRALDEAFTANGFSGAAVFLDPRTGEILAMTSRPSYDPNDFANGMDRSKLSSLNRDPLKPFQDRLIQGTYAPGSTFKPLMAIAGLAEHVITPDTKFFCPGSITLYGRVFHCDNKNGHGWLDLRHAIEKSCNVYFFSVAKLLDVDTIYSYAQRLGLAGKTGIDLPGENESIVPSTEWKMRTQHEKWYPGETISVGIGQGYVSVTPIALARMISTIANGGTLVTPHVVKALDEGEGWIPAPVSPPRSLFPIPPDILSVVHDGLWLAVNEAGTGGNAKIAGRDVAGKTGTAQVISNEGRAAAGKTTVDLRDNGWFEFFAPKDNPVIAGVIMAEHSGHGGTSVAPIARYVLETFFNKMDGKPLPALPESMKKTSPAASAAPAAPAATARQGGQR
jgi:penicillin-binding protein 2